MKLPKTSIETISPEIAAEYLKQNTVNRVLRPSHVKELAGAIKRGEWKVTHQGIAFDVTGALRDGQHRLSAIVLSGKAVQIMVTRDLEEECKLVMDRGVIRTNADLTGLPRRHVEVLTIFASLRKDGDLSSKVSPQEVLTQQPVFGAALERLESGAPTARVGISSAPVRAAAVLWMTACHEEALEQYRAMTVLDFDAMHPVVKALVRQLMGAREAVRGVAVREGVFARAVTAFDPENAGMSKIQISNLAVRLREARKLVDGVWLKIEKGVAA
jgi:hypothetical protein